MLSDRIALVTGASRGIGAAIATALGGAGAHVVVLARTVGGLEEVDDAVRAAGGTASLLPMDLTAPDKIEQAAPALFQRFGRLDILVSAAAMLGALTPAAQIKPKDWQSVLATNLDANFRLIQAFDPLLRHSDAARAVFLTDCVAAGRAYWGGYAASKAGLEALVRSWAQEIAKTPIRANLLDPGPTATRLRARAFPGEPDAAHPDPGHVIPTVMDLVAQGCARHGEVVSCVR